MWRMGFLRVAGTWARVIQLLRPDLYWRATLARRAMADRPISGSAPPPPAQPGPVRRLTFEYDGDQIRLVSEQHVRMIVPSSQPPEQAGAAGGLQVLLRDQQDQPVLRLARSNPIQHDAEVFSPPGAERSIERAPVDRPKGSCVL